MVEEWLVVRYGKIVFRKVNLFALHSEVIDKKGAVIFGKIGKPIGQSRIMKIAEVIRERGSARMILVGPKEGGRRFFEAKVVGIFRVLPEKKRELVPAYYKEMGFVNNIRTWFEVIEMKESAVFKGQYATLSSGREFLEALDLSVAGSFVVTVVGEK